MKEKVLGHLRNAERLWNDEKVETPGSSLEDFVMNTYGPTVQRKEQEKLMAPLNRYKSYFKLPGGM